MTRLLVLLALALAACSDLPSASVDREAERNAQANPLDIQGLNEIMLTVAGSEEAVLYFRQALAADPENATLRRGLARSLARDGQHAEARIVWRELVDSGRATDEDRVEYALSLARLDQWAEVEAQLAQLPPDRRSPRQAMLRALLADHRQSWAEADAAYEQARAVSPQPGAVLNNWGVSKMARGDFPAAERLFEQALTYDPALFSAKNNLALSYGLQRRYQLPVLTLTGEEKATLYHNLAVIALRQGDREAAEGLLQQSVEAHPSYYAPAADKLAALRGARG